jgi:agmatinase
MYPLVANALHTRINGLRIQGVSGRPGERSGPLGIRLGSQRLGGYSIFTGVKALDNWAEIVDCGDAPLTPLDKHAAFEQLEIVHKVEGYTHAY